jgi:hypothetical protein
MTPSSWYIGSWESVYFDLFSTDSRLQRFKLIIKSDLSDASLHFINMSKLTLNDLKTAIDAFRFCDGYRFCEDALVIFWINYKDWGAFTGLTSAPFTSVVTRWNFGLGTDSESFCPTSGRFVYRTSDYDDDGNIAGRIVVA